MTPRRKRTSTARRLKILLLMSAALLIVATALAAGPAINRLLLAPGGGYLDGAGINLQSAIGQPVGGSVTNGVTLCSGLICGSGAATTGKQIYLPAVFRDT